jgi:hypothetical protein
VKFWSELIFDNGFRLSIQNAWKNSPHTGMKKIKVHGVQWRAFFVHVFNVERCWRLSTTFFVPAACSGHGVTLSMYFEWKDGIQCQKSILTNFQKSDM